MYIFSKALLIGGIFLCGCYTPIGSIAYVKTPEEFKSSKDADHKQSLLFTQECITTSKAWIYKCQATAISSVYSTLRNLNLLENDHLKDISIYYKPVQNYIAVRVDDEELIKKAQERK